MKGKANKKNRETAYKRSCAHGKRLKWNRRTIKKMLNGRKKKNKGNFA